jgi:hypothetical protein
MRTHPSLEAEPHGKRCTRSRLRDAVSAIRGSSALGGYGNWRCLPWVELGPDHGFVDATGERIGVVDDAVGARAPVVGVAARFCQMSAAELDDRVTSGVAVENDGDAVERTGDVIGEE